MKSRSTVLQFAILLIFYFFWNSTNSWASQRPDLVHPNPCAIALSLERNPTHSRLSRLLDGVPPREQNLHIDAWKTFIRFPNISRDEQMKLTDGSSFRPEMKFMIGLLEELEREALSDIEGRQRLLSENIKMTPTTRDVMQIEISELQKRIALIKEKISEVKVVIRNPSFSYHELFQTLLFFYKITSRHREHHDDDPSEVEKKIKAAFPFFILSPTTDKLDYLPLFDRFARGNMPVGLNPPNEVSFVDNVKGGMGFHRFLVHDIDHAYRLIERFEPNVDLQKELNAQILRLSKIQKFKESLQYYFSATRTEPARQKKFDLICLVIHSLFHESFDDVSSNGCRCQADRISSLPQWRDADRVGFCRSIEKRLRHPDDFGAGLNWVNPAADLGPEIEAALMAVLNCAPEK